VKRQKLKILLLLAVLALFVVAGACKDSSAQPGGRAQRAGNLGEAGGGSGEGRTFGTVEAGEIIITDTGFDPDETGGGLRVSQFGTVTWVNNGTEDHHPVEDTGYFDMGVIKPGEKSEPFTFNAVGLFTFRDELNPEFTGMVTVARGATR
jgi:plastocyanin